MSFSRSKTKYKKKLLTNNNMKNIKGWDDISLKQFQELNQIETEDEIENIIQKISIVYDLDPSEVEKIPLVELMEMANNLSFLMEEPTTVNDYKRFKLMGIEYGLEPEFSKLTTGQFIDFEEYFKDGMLKNLHYLTGILFRPVTKSGEKYEIENYDGDTLEERSKLFLDLPITQIYSSLLFFSNIVTIYLSGIHQFLERELMKKKM
jgi:hypothetical protein